MGTVSFFPSFFSRCFFKPKATFSLHPLETGIQAFYYPNSLRGILTKHRRSLTVPLNELNFHRSNFSASRIDLTRPRYVLFHFSVNRSLW